MFICPECRSVYPQAEKVCERDQSQLVPVQANQDPRTYPLLNTELDGRYHLIGGLGQGGVGTVYLANHIHLDQLSAVKFLDVDMLGEVDEEQREESLQDFVKEAKLAMMLRHDYVVRVMDYGVHERCPFLVMEYVPGPSLLRRMNAGEKFTIEQCINVITRLAEALSAFHDRKLVHRDLKPANVILDPRDNGEITLVDLGLVKDLSNEARSSTHPLALRGTPGYLAPEQVPSWVLSSAGADVAGEKQPVDARVDIYALGILAFELFSGQTPYPKGMSPTKVIVHMCTKPPPNLAEFCPELQASHPRLVKLVNDMMARRPQERPIDARGVLARLKEISSEPSFTPLQGEVSINSEIERAKQALISHVKSIPLATTGIPSQYAKIQEGKHRQEAVTNEQFGNPHLPPRPSNSSLGSLIPPPASLLRPNQSMDIHSQSLDQSTMHLEETLDGTVDEIIDLDRQTSVDLVGDDLLNARTEIADRPLAYQKRSKIALEANHAYVLDEEQNRNSDKPLFWIGVVLVSIIIGGASVLFNDVESDNKTPTKFVLGSSYKEPIRSRLANRGDSKRRGLNSRGSKQSLSKKSEQLTYEPPPLRRPSRDSDDRLDVSRLGSTKRSTGGGVVEVKVKAPQISQRQGERERERERDTKIKRPSRSRKVSKSRRKRSRTQSSDSEKAKRNLKPLSKRQYRLLKLQVENLLRNQRVIEARRKLSTVKRRLKPSDEFYMEINMLLDSISN